MLDRAKMPQVMQDNILKMLYSGGRVQTPIVATPEDDFGGAGLGMLLRHAGPSWDGGRHGFEALSSFKGLCTTFEQYGMPKTE